MPAAILQDIGIAYFAVPKSASTSMKLTLYDLREGHPWEDAPNLVHKQFRTWPITPQDFEAARPYWKFAILRDPVKRLLSAYGNRVVARRDIERHRGRSRIRRLYNRLRYPGLPDLPTAEMFYLNLGNYQKISYSIWHHTTGVRTFIGTDLAYFDALYRIDDIPALEAELGRRAGRAITLPREQTEGPKIALGDLPRPVQERILEETAPDYELLRDFFSPPKI